MFVGRLFALANAKRATAKHLRTEGEGTYDMPTTKMEPSPLARKEQTSEGGQNVAVTLDIVCFE